MYYILVIQKVKSKILNIPYLRNKIHKLTNKYQRLSKQR